MSHVLFSENDTCFAMFEVVGNKTSKLLIYFLFVVWGIYDNWPRQQSDHIWFWTSTNVETQWKLETTINLVTPIVVLTRLCICPVSYFRFTLWVISISVYRIVRLMAFISITKFWGHITDCHCSGVIHSRAPRLSGKNCKYKYDKICKIVSQEHNN